MKQAQKTAIVAPQATQRSLVADQTAAGIFNPANQKLMTAMLFALWYFPQLFWGDTVVLWIDELPVVPDFSAQPFDYILKAFLGLVYYLALNLVKDFIAKRAASKPQDRKGLLESFLSLFRKKPFDPKQKSRSSTKP